MTPVTVPYQGQDRLVVRRAREGDEGFDPDIKQVVVKMGGGEEIVVPYESDDEGGEQPTEPPTVVDAPYVSQTGPTTLNCTMGNWNGTPSSYAYQWQLDGDDVPSTGADLTVTPDDVGKSALCVLTATNALGSDEVISNEITIV